MTSLSAKVKIRDDKYVVIYHRNKMWRTGVSIESPNEFSKGLLTKSYKGIEDYKDLNIQINNKLQLINGLIKEASNKGVDSLQYVNAFFHKEEKNLKRISLTNNTSLVEAFTKWTQWKKNKQKDMIKENSFCKYTCEISRLNDYEKICPTVISDLQDVQWFIDFAKYLTKPFKKTYNVIDEKNEREYTATKTLTQTNGTIKRFLFDLVAFLKFIQLNNKELEFPIEEINDELIGKLSSAKDESDSVVALTKAQWKAFKKYQPREKFEWEIKAYYLFRFALNVGMRYSDCIVLHDLYVSKDNVIRMKATKTRGAFEVVMNEDAVRIFNMFGRDFRNKFSTNQRTNINLTKILKRIPEFCQDMIYYEFVLTKVVEKVDKAFNIITFHASRRTFVSFAIQNGATIAQIQKFTGWKDIRMLMVYLKIFGEKENNDKSILAF